MFRLCSATGITTSWLPKPTSFRRLSSHPEAVDLPYIDMGWTPVLTSSFEATSNESKSRPSAKHTITVLWSLWVTLQKQIWGRSMMLVTHTCCCSCWTMDVDVSVYAANKQPKFKVRTDVHLIYQQYVCERSVLLGPWGFSCHHTSILSNSKSPDFTKASLAGLSPKVGVLVVEQLQTLHKHQLLSLNLSFSSQLLSTF